MVMNELIERLKTFHSETDNDHATDGD
jgi:hypothetical protein